MHHRISNSAQSRLRVRKKTGRCTQLSCKTKSSELITRICYMKYIIAMKSAKRTTSTVIKCSDKSITEMSKEKFQEEGKGLSCLADKIMTHHLSTLNTQSWSLTRRLLLQHALPWTNTVRQAYSQQKRHLRREEYSQMPQMLRLSIYIKDNFSVQLKNILFHQAIFNIIE